VESETPVSRRLKRQKPALINDCTAFGEEDLRITICNESSGFRRVPEFDVSRHPDFDPSNQKNKIRRLRYQKVCSGSSGLNDYTAFRRLPDHNSERYDFRRSPGTCFFQFLERHFVYGPSNQKNQFLIRL
jgi:hypothetical protein